MARESYTIHPLLFHRRRGGGRERGKTVRSSPHEAACRLSLSLTPSLPSPPHLTPTSTTNSDISRDWSWLDFRYDFLPSGGRGRRTGWRGGRGLAYGAN